MQHNICDVTYHTLSTTITTRWQLHDLGRPYAESRRRVQVQQPPVHR